MLTPSIVSPWEIDLGYAEAMAKGDYGGALDWADTAENSGLFWQARLIRREVRRARRACRGRR